MADPRARLLELIQRVYAAPGSKHGWQAFLDDLHAAVDGAAASFDCRDLASHRGGLSFAARMEPEVKARASAVGRLDPWMRSDVAINAGERLGRFGPRDTAVLEVLVPHIRQALQIHARLAATGLLSNDLAQVLDRENHAVFLVDAGSRVSYLNQPARLLVERRDGLTVARGELSATNPAATSRLRALLCDVAAASRGDGAEAGGALAVPRQGERRDLLVRVFPMTQRSTWLPFIDAPVAMVFATDPERAPALNESALRHLYGLTPAEIRLTSLLARGATLTTAAARLGWRVESARTRLKTIFGKTGTHRQAELVRLLLNGAPGA